MVDVKWICLSVSSCRGQFSSVGEVRDQSLQSVGAADVLQISFGAFVLVSFDAFVFVFFFMWQSLQEWDGRAVVIKGSWIESKPSRPPGSSVLFSPDANCDSFFHWFFSIYIILVILIEEYSYPYKYVDILVLPACKVAIVHQRWCSSPSRNQRTACSQILTASEILGWPSQLLFHSTTRWIF